MRFGPAFGFSRSGDGQLARRAKRGPHGSPPDVVVRVAPQWQRLSLLINDGSAPKKDCPSRAGVMMALFGLLWLMRVRAEVRKERRKRMRQLQQPVINSLSSAPVVGIMRNNKDPSIPNDHHHHHGILLPPPDPFADPAAALLLRRRSTEDISFIPPPPPPPLIHRTASRDGADWAAAGRRRPPSSASFFPSAAVAQSRSAQNIPLECTCPVLVMPRRPPFVRFRDDPLGFQSARGLSWHYPSVVSTLPRNRRQQQQQHPLRHQSGQGDAGETLQARAECAIIPNGFSARIPPFRPPFSAFYLRPTGNLISSKTRTPRIFRSVI